jgi:signal transduction histidine kinase
VVTEETTNSVMSVRSAALERLLLLTLAAFGGAAVLLMAFATRLSMRIRGLRDEAESAIDARGRITHLTAGSDAADEIGDLSRSFSAVLERLAEHHAYLESMAGRLSHELRTPIAVVRSSLENLKISRENPERYIERAEEGLARLGRILERMTEASRLEQSLRSVERSRYDLGAVVRGCVEGYRVAYPQAAFALALPAGRVEVEGAPDLAAQLLDKLVENAVDFSRGAPVRVALEALAGSAALSVTNQGPLLPDKMRTRLFESMISVRDAPASATTPHLGLGLYVARLIAEFHGGAIAATNLPSGDGVVVGVRLPLAAK